MGRIVGVVFLMILLAACGGNSELKNQVQLGGLALQLPPVTSLGGPRDGSAATYLGHNADDYFLKSDNTILDGSELTLNSSPGELSWAIYDYSSMRFDLADSTLLLGHNPQGEGTVYVAFANYDRNTWDFVALEVTAGLRSDEVTIPQDSPYLSGSDTFYVAVLAWDGLDTILGEVDIAMGVENAAPQNLDASDGTHAGWIFLDWEPVDFAQGYLVEYKPSSADDSAWVELNGPPGIPNHQYAHVYWGEPGSDPEYGVSYDYRVRTYFPDGDVSAYSDVDSGYRAIPPPQNLTATYNIYDGAIELNWDAVQTITGYKVYRKYYLDPDYSLLTTTSETTLLDSSLPDNDIYEYQVLAYSSEAEGPPSVPAQGSALGFTFSDFQTFCDTKPDIRMMEMTGKIAVGYFDTRFDDLYFAHATTLYPIGVGSWLHFNLNRGHDSGELTLGMLGGKPAMAYRFDATDSVEFIWCDKPVPFTSPEWFSTPLDKSGNAVGRPSWVEADGVPAVCFHTDPTGSDPGLYYYYATDSKPQVEGDWNSYLLESGNTAGLTASMQVVAGYPAIVGNMDGFVGFFYDAADSAQPTSSLNWSNYTASNNSDTSRNIELVVHDGLPYYATSVDVYADPERWMIMNNQARVTFPKGPGDWQNAGYLDANPNDIGLSLDLTFVNDRPAICYYDEGDQGLKLAMAKSPTPSSEDWVVNTVVSGPNVGRSCALMEYRGVPVLLYWNPNTQKIRFAQGE